MRKVLKVLVSNRMIILTILGASMYIGISQFHISLWYILFYGIFLGVIFGKVFCRWVCPMGLIMEMMMSMGGEDVKSSKCTNIIKSAARLPGSPDY